MPIYISAIYSILSCHAFSFKGKKTPNQQIISLITVCYADLFVGKSFIKKAIEKRSYYSDTPGKFALLKELKRNFLQIFVVDSSCFCNFVAENERFNQRKIIPSVFVTFLFVLSLFLSWLYLFLYSGCGISEMYLARC